MRCKSVLFAVVLSVVSPVSVYAVNYACKPSYVYEGWMPKRTITLNSSYYRGYGNSVEEAMAESVFLCERVYRHCKADVSSCKPTRTSVTQCWVQHHLANGFHHDRNAAGWIAKNRCLYDLSLRSEGASSCVVVGCRQARKAVDSEEETAR